MRKCNFRLGVDFHTWDGIFQGSRSHILGLYREAIDLAPDIDFVFFLKDIESLRSAHPVFNRPNVELIAMSHQPSLVRLAIQLPWLQWRHKINMLHTQYRLPLLRLGACACTVHDILFETHPQFFSKTFVIQSKITYRQAVKRAKCVFAVSEYSKAELIRLYGVSSGQVDITYNGVDRFKFRPGPDGAEQVEALGLQPGRYLLTVGRLEPRKNHSTLIAAYATLGVDAPPLVIVGQQDFSFQATYDAVKQHRLEGRVHFLPSVADDVLPAVLRHAFVFVYPAFAEGFGMPVAEAMASGVPVITSNTTSMPEVGGDAALYIDPSSAPDLASKMKIVLSDDALRSQMREAGLKQVSKFDWRHSAQVLINRIRHQLH